MDYSLNIPFFFGQDFLLDFIVFSTRHRKRKEASSINHVSECLELGEGKKHGFCYMQAGSKTLLFINSCLAMVLSMLGYLYG
jgi:hypothetical protein